MQLKLLSTDDCQALLAFETQNKTYFEASVPPRANTYFNFEELHKIIEGITKEQAAGECFLYLVFEDNKLIGRANLVNVNNGNAELGYRLAKNSAGKGKATKMIEALVKIAKTQHQLTSINAHTTVDNIGSIRVLEKTGFKHIKIVKNAAKLNGKNLDFTYFKLNL